MKMISTNPTTDGNKVKAGECGAIEMILNVMKTNKTSTGVCKYGCGALCNITFNGKHHSQK